MTSQTPRIPHGRLNTNSRRPDNAANQASETLAGIHQAAASYQAQASDQRNPALFSGASPPLVSHVITTTASASSAGSKSLQSDAVLPSPAPSDEPQQGSVHIIDPEDDTAEDGEGGQPRPEDLQEKVDEGLNANRFGELPERHGGVGELEKRPRDSESGNNSPMSFSVNVSSESVQNIPSITARKRVQENESFSRKRVQSVQRSSSERSSQPPMTPITNAVEPALPAPSEWKPPVSTATTFLAHLNKRAETINNRHGQAIELSRFGLLRDACLCQDYFYFMIHQLFCLSPQSLVSPNLAPGLTSEHQAGLVLLERILLPNDQLSVDTKAWFSTFPLLIASLLEKWPGLREIYDRVLYCLTRLPQWFRIRDHCQFRNYPPLIDEMVDMLGVDSLVLQRGISRVIMREIWPGEQDECFNDADKLFPVNQQEVRHRQSLVGTPAAPTPSKILEYNTSLSHSYQRIWAQHQQHLPKQLIRTNQQNSQQLSGRPPGINTSMVPPQQVYAGIPPARNMSFSRGLYQPSSSPSSPSVISPVSTSPQATLQNFPNNFDRPRMVPSTPSSPAYSSNPAMRTSSASWHPSVSRSQSGGAVSQSNRRVLQSNQPSSMVLTPNISQNPTAMRNPPHGTHQREHPNVQHFQPPFRFVDGLRGRPNLDAMQSPTQFSAQNTPQNTNATFPENQPFTGYINSYPTTSPNGQQFGMGQAPVHYTNSSPNQPSMPPRVLPPQGHTPSTTEPSNPGSSALHQAQARSPNCVSFDNSGRPNDIKDCFGYVRRLDIIPNRLNTKRRHFKWTFEISKEMFDLLVQETEASNGVLPIRRVRTGTWHCRIRCIKINGDDVFNESEWVVADNVWPNGVAVLMNGRALEIRKKFHHGKDLPIDVTKHLRQGTNTLSIATTSPKPNENVSYEVGIETIEITDSSRIQEDLTMLDVPEALKRILKHSTSNDPEVQVVDETVLLDLTDPYTSRIFNLPVRGRTCRHNQCFDLHVFLQTRSRKTPHHLPSPEYFKCPVCGVDARPQSLVMDLFFKQLRTELEAIDRLDVKAVFLGERGEWTIKEEEEVGEPGDGLGRRTSGPSGIVNSRGRGLSIPINSEIIEIDDD